ncbi:MAG: hypothetical protein CM15mP80_09850 [Alphaproteobacteria bacterium]|nr:MAG: hypothetical protein CM15mP80_09850 [Alphaproteobacteria bacterium]
MRRDLTNRMRRIGRKDAFVSISYAATEMQVGSVECCPDSGYHNPAPDHFYFEIVDQTRTNPFLKGTGLSVLTHLDRRGTVLCATLWVILQRSAQSNVHIAAAGPTGL